MSAEIIKTDQPPTEIALDPVPKGERKAIGGGVRDQWNDRITTLVVTALPDQAAERQSCF
jgi:hypothetical protein